jgi:hypothetical protein
LGSVSTTSALVVSVDPCVHVLGRTDIVTTIRAQQDVDVEFPHGL